ncbi:MAG: hypothetical protein ABIG03_05545 [Candidatus Eisenbacteria bacterium]
MNRIRSAYDTLLREFGHQDWWPSESTFETAVGAVLTQGTAWVNAERAVASLRSAAALTPEGLGALTREHVESLVRPAGFHRRKAASLKKLVGLVGGRSQGWNAFLALPSERARGALLEVPGIGPETADAILLYAAERPVFVVDEYTRRFSARHGLSRARAGYDALQSLFESSLPRDAALFAEYHALLVKLGKDFCKTKPLCEMCPLRADLPQGP